MGKSMRSNHRSIMKGGKGKGKKKGKKRKSNKKRKNTNDKQSHRALLPY